MSDFEWRYPPVEVEWSKNDEISAYYIEGWQFGQTPLHEAPRHEIDQGPLVDKENILKWVHQKEPFNLAEKLGDDRGPCTGGLRLLVFDRTHLFPLDVTIDEDSVDELLKEFQLVPETIPILLTAEGGMRYRFQRKGGSKAKTLQLLVQSNQILKVANFMISLSYDFETKWTTAIACVKNDKNDYEDGPLAERLGFVTNAVANNQGLWAHPTFLPTVFATHYSDEMRESRSILRSDITHINRSLGFTGANSFRPEGLPEDWPEHLDFRWLITNIHARRVEVMQVREGCKWSCKSLQWLRDLEEQICKEGILNEDLSHNTQKVLEYHLSVIEGTEWRFATLQEESEASTNMLFNAITQRDSIIAQRYNDIARRIATSTKEDSISMSTFTFITALFLPGTFLATFLSLTMIDWQPGSFSSPGGNQGISSGSTQVSKFYWVFWAIDIPLTVFVMLGWWVWFRRAKTTWVRENGIMLSPDESKSDISKMLRLRSKERRSRRRSRSLISLDTISTKDEEKRSWRTRSIRTVEDSDGEGSGESSVESGLPGIVTQNSRKENFRILGKLSKLGRKSAQRGNQGEATTAKRRYIREDGDCKDVDEKESSPALPTRPLAAGLRDRLTRARPASLGGKEKQVDVERGSGGRSVQSL